MVAQSGEHANNKLHQNDEFTDPNGERSVNGEDVVPMGRPIVCGLDPDLGDSHLHNTQSSNPHKICHAVLCSSILFQMLHLSSGPLTTQTDFRYTSVSARSRESKIVSIPLMGRTLQDVDSDVIEIY
jgi:hypothetical protein